MRRIAIAVLVVLALAAGYYAFRPKPETPGDQGGGGGQQSQEPVTITFYSGKDLTGSNEALVEEFNRTHDNIKVNYQEMPPSTTDQHDKYVSVLAAKSADIDVMAADVPWAPEFAAAGWLLPLEDRLTDKEDFFEGAFLGTTYEGSIYAIPWFIAAGVLYYRQDLLEEAGIDPPETFDELISAAQALQNENRYGFIWQGAQYEGLVCDWLEIYWGMGGRILDEDGNFVADKAIMADSMQLMQDFIHKHNITPTAVTTWKENEGQAIFADDRGVFFRAWPGNFGYLSDPETSKIAGKVGIKPMVHAPGQSSAATLGTWNLAISKYSKHPDAAWEFVEFMTNYESQKTKALMSGNPPSRKSTYDDEELLEKFPHYADYFDVFEGALPRPVTPVYPEMSVDVLQPNIASVLNREKTAQQAAEDMYQGMQRMLEQ